MRIGRRLFFKIVIGRKMLVASYAIPAPAIWAFLIVRDDGPIAYAPALPSCGLHFGVTISTHVLIPFEDQPLATAFSKYAFSAI